MQEKSEIPIHVAVIPDGNRRWARERNLPTIEGHRRGFDIANELVHAGHSMGISTMTIWAFSTENWKRTTEEVGYLMKLFEMMIDRNLAEAHQKKTHIIHLGRKDRLPQSLRAKILKTEKETAQYSDHYLCVGIDYGGEDELVRAIAQESQKGGEWNHDKLLRSLDTSSLPQQEVDLVIRTSGEQRTSGFMPLQTAYAEYHFSPLLFPDFNTEQFTKVIHDYSLRNRRFGK